MTSGTVDLLTLVSTDYKYTSQYDRWTNNFRRKHSSRKITRVSRVSESVPREDVMRERGYNVKIRNTRYSMGRVSNGDWSSRKYLKGVNFTCRCT